MMSQRSNEIARRFVVLTLLTSWSVAGCVGEPEDTEATGGEYLRSEAIRDTSPEVPPTDQQTLAEGNGAFAFDLYHALSEEEGNLFYSPFSISVALAMTYAGARGETEAEMAETLHFTLGQEGLHPAINWLDLELESRGEGAAGTDGEPFRLNIANALWGQVDYTFQPEFLDLLAVNYDAGMRLLPFRSDPEGSRVTINDWVSDQTEGLIEDLIPTGVITPLTRLVLTNAIYFNGAWDAPFDEAATRDGAFTLPSGDEVTVDMMHQREELRYGADEDYQAVEMRYDGGELSMVILLPAAGSFEAFEDTLATARVGEIIDGMTINSVVLSLPKFEYESKFELAETLEALGMERAFDPLLADFRGIEPRGELYISDVIHQAFVSVDEEGTEAAAATAVVMPPGESEPPPPVEMTIDRPFIFLIRDIETNTILFVGRVENPNA